MVCSVVCVDYVRLGDVFVVATGNKIRTLLVRVRAGADKISRTGYRSVKTEPGKNN